MIYLSLEDYTNFKSNLTSSGKNSGKLNCDGAYCYSDDVACKSLQGELQNFAI